MYATTREFLDRFGLNDISDLPRIEDMAEVLGFEPPSGLSGSPEAPTPLPFEDVRERDAEPDAAPDTSSDEKATDETVH
jgi:hypothetical protein